MGRVNTVFSPSPQGTPATARQAQGHGHIQSDAVDTGLATADDSKGGMV